MWKRTMALVLLLLSVEIINSYLVFADTLVLKNGQKIEGKIIQKTEAFVKIEENGVPTTYFTEEIDKIQADTARTDAVNKAVSDSNPPANNKIVSAPAEQPAADPVASDAPEVEITDPLNPDSVEILNAVKNYLVHQDDKDPTQALSSVKKETRAVWGPGMEMRGKQRHPDNTLEFDDFKVVSLRLKDTAATVKVSFTIRATRPVLMQKDETGWKIVDFMTAPQPKNPDPAKKQ